jgi:hypothetical protein
MTIDYSERERDREREKERERGLCFLKMKTFCISQQTSTFVTKVFVHLFKYVYIYTNACDIKLYTQYICVYKEHMNKNSKYISPQHTHTNV